MSDDVVIKIVDVEPVSRPLRLPSWWRLPDGRVVWVEKIEVLPDARYINTENNMSWSFAFTAESKEAAAKEIDAQQYVPEELKTLLKNTIETMLSKPQHHNADTMKSYRIRVESNGHHDGAGGWNSNGTYRVGFEKVVGSGG